MQFDLIDLSSHHLPHVLEAVGRLALRPACCPDLDRGITVAALDRTQFPLRAPCVHGETVLVSRIVQLPRAVVPVRDEHPLLVPHLVTGVQAVDNVTAQPVDGGCDEPVVGAPFVTEPGAEPGAGHGVGRARDFPVVRPPSR